MNPRSIRRHRRAQALRHLRVPYPSRAGVAPEALSGPVAMSPEALADAKDHELLHAVGGGSVPALEELLHRHGSAVHDLAELLAHDGGTVDALVVDVFIALSRRFGHLEDGLANVRLGLMAMARRRSPRSDDAIDRPAEAGDVDELATATPLSRLRSLPRKHREPVALTVMTRATLSEVALVLGAERELVASRLRSGLQSAWIAATPAPL